MTPDRSPSQSVTSRKRPKTDRDLAVALMRQQINQLYDDPNTTTAAPPTQQLEHVYDKTHDESAVHDVNTEQWQHYHTALAAVLPAVHERYYLAQVHAREQRHLAKDSLATVRHQTKTAAEFLAAEETVSRDRALHEIRSDLTEKIKYHAQRARKKSPFCTDLERPQRHGRFCFAVQRVDCRTDKILPQPGSISPQNIIVDATTTPTTVGKDSRIIMQTQRRRTSGL